MSKYLKSLLIAGLVVCMTVCLGIFAAACNNNDDGDKGGDDTFPSSVSVTVMLDKTTPASVMVQLCAVEDNGELGLCLSPVATNKQGVATIDIDKENGKQYEIHLLGVPDGYTYVDGLGAEYPEGSGLRIDVTKNASVTITLKATVADTSNDPIALTVGGNAENFSVNLEEFIDRNGQPDETTGEIPPHLSWNDSRYAKFTTNEVGKYKFTFTFELSNDDVIISAYAGANYASFSNSGYTTNGMFLTYEFEKAETEYMVRIDTNISDYADIAPEGTTSLNYSVKVEFVDGDDSPSIGDDDEYTRDEDISVGANKRKGGNYEYYFDPGAVGKYTITVDNDATVSCTIGVGNDISGSTIEVTIQNESDFKTIKINKDCTITITLVTSDNSDNSAE